MNVQHVTIDGSSVSIEADADLSRNIVTSGWAMVPSLMQSHPFAADPPGHCDAIEEAVSTRSDHFVVKSRSEFNLADGKLRVAEVEMPTATNQRRYITFAGWDSHYGCLTSSLVGSKQDVIIEAFDTLDFTANDRGVWIRSAVFTEPRVPELTKEIPELGIVNVRPAIASELEFVPKARGHVTSNGELFRIRSSSDALMFVSDSAISRIDPLPGIDGSRIVRLAEGLKIEWIVRGIEQ